MAHRAKVPKYLRALDTHDLLNVVDGLKKASTEKSPEAFLKELRQIMASIPTRYETTEALTHNSIPGIHLIAWPRKSYRTTKSGRGRNAYKFEEVR